MNYIGTRLIIPLLAALPLLARGGGDEVVLVYNTSVPESKAVAEHYAELRHVPARQIYGFTLTTNELISRDEFRDSLQLPLARRLETDKLWQIGPVTYAATNGRPARVEQRVIASKIRYAVLCYGMPLRVAEVPDPHEAGKDNPNSDALRNEAAVDSELAWLPLVQLGVSLSGPLLNWVYGTTNAAMLNPTNGILLVARIDGPTPNIARGLADRALQGERDGLWGRAYFDARGLDKTNNYYLGDEWMLGGAELCREFGFETTVDDKPATFPADFPMSQIAIYCGWYEGSVTGPFAQPKVEFMPGAFAYHLHSASATSLRTTTEYWVGPLLAKGVTCTMGCVTEPYLACTPNVPAFLARWIGAGFTFGEAAWAAQPVLSWQTTVIGDPLYRPFGREPAEMHADFARNQNPLIEWSYLRIVDLGLERRTPVAKLVALLENIPTTTNSAVLTEKLADLYEAQGKPSSAITTYQLALTRNPSPEQRIRLHLTLGAKFTAAERDTEAIAEYKELLRETPNYPGKPSIEAKLAALQQKLVNASNH